MKATPTILAAAALTASIAPALASSSDWQRFEGASLRIVVSDTPAADGTRRAALEIDLVPGWKTYWLDPGSSGVPPSVSVTAAGEDIPAGISLPAPRRLGDGYGAFSGFDRPVSIAVTFTLAGGRPDDVLDFPVFIGICDTICIPIQTSLRNDLPSASDADEAAVQAAFAALPAEPTPQFGVRSAWTDGDELVVDVALPGDAADADLFTASPERFSLGAPRREGTRFRVPILDRPTDATTGDIARYTLVSNGEAVAGTFILTGHP